MRIPLKEGDDIKGVKKELWK